MSIFFDSDFESTFAADGWTTPSGSFMTISTQQAISGTHCSRKSYDNVNGSSQQPSISRDVTASDELFMRVGIRISSGFLCGSNGATKQIRYLTTAQYPIVWLYFYNGGGSSTSFSYAFNVENPYQTIHPSGWLVSGVQPSSAGWDQIQTQVTMNTPGVANGILRMWVNGTLSIDTTNLQLRGPTPSSVGIDGLTCPSTAQFMTVQDFLQSGLGTVYTDRTAVGSTMIDRVGVSPDVTPPAVPTGVTVN